MDDITAEQIYNLGQSSAHLCDIEDALWTSVLLRDWASVQQWVTGFVHGLVNS